MDNISWQSLSTRFNTLKFFCICFWSWLMKCYRCTWRCSLPISFPFLLLGISIILKLGVFSHICLFLSIRHNIWTIFTISLSHKDGLFSCDKSGNGTWSSSHLNRLNLMQDILFPVYCCLLILIYISLVVNTCN